jgi:hypothetical protein
MPWCQHCGKEIGMENDYCPFCGSKVFPSSSHFFDVPIEDEHYRTFIQNRADYYLKKFRKFQFAGPDHFAVTWHWPAFWLGFVWMIYRKMYFWAGIAFIIALTPVAFPLTMVGWAITANYLYYLHSKKKILEYRSRETSGPSAISLNELGGVNRWVWFAGFFFLIVLLLLMGVGLLLLLYFFKNQFTALPDFLEV